MAKKSAKTAAPAQPVAGASVAPVAPPIPTAPPVPAVPATAQPPVEVPAAPKDTKNNITRPGAGTTTRTVWDIADGLSASGAPAKRKDVVEQCTKNGINASTATTQYGKWTRYHGFVGTNSPSAHAAPAAPAAPVAPPVPTVPAAVAAPTAWQKGYDNCQAYATTEDASLGNPYPEGTPDNVAFNAGWAKSSEDIANSSSVE